MQADAVSRRRGRRDLAGQGQESTDAPIAENVNGRNSRPTIAQLGHALADLWRDPDCHALSIGQLDPAHARADPTAIPRLVAMLGEVVAAG